MDGSFERTIIIGLITSTDYLQQIEGEWNPRYMKTDVAKTISRWCWDFYEQKGKAPNRKIERLLMKHMKKLDADLADEIQHDLLPSLSQEYDDKDFDLKDALEETREYFRIRQLQLYNEDSEKLLAKGKIDEAQALFENTDIVTGVEDESLDLADIEIAQKLWDAFNEEYQNVIRFPGALGEFWNNQLVRGGLVSLLAPEKRGKTFWLLEFMMRAYRQKRKVAFFQAGDMTEAEQLLRTAVYLAKKSNQKEYCGVHYIPVRDCILNHNGECRKNKSKEQNGVELGLPLNRSEYTFEYLKESMVKGWEPCRNCKSWYSSEKKLGAPYLKKIDVGNEPLEYYEAKELFTKFFSKTERVRLSTHVNGTLSIEKIRATLLTWKKQGFVPDVIIIDYADLLVTSKHRDERHNINHIWKGLRALSQEFNALTIAPTQADADAYEKDLLTLKNFSEDKRKMAHVTAMYGLNQDKEGREKEIGIMRINKIVVRSGAFHNTHQVNVLQRLEIGRPYLGSYW